MTTWRWVVLAVAWAGCSGDGGAAEGPEDEPTDSGVPSETPEDSAEDSGTIASTDPLPDAADLPAAYEAARRLRYAGCTRTTDGDLIITTVFDAFGWPIQETMTTSDGAEVFTRDTTYVRVDDRVTESSFVYTAPPGDGACAFSVVAETSEVLYDEGERPIQEQRNSRNACGDRYTTDFVWTYDIAEDVLRSSEATVGNATTTTEYDLCAMPVRSVSAGFTSEFTNTYEGDTCIPAMVEGGQVVRWVYVDGRMDHYQTSSGVTQFTYSGCLR